MRLRNCDPAVMHSVGYLLLEGTALTELETVLSTTRQPRTWDTLVSFLSEKFPSNLTKASVMARIKTRVQKSNEPAIEYYDAFMKIKMDATAVELQWEPLEVFVAGLQPSLRKFVGAEADRATADKTTLSFEKIDLLAITKDNRYQSERKQESVNSVDSKSKKKDNKRKATNKDERTCYNCGEKGHIFGTLEKKLCSAEVSEKTLAYFKKAKSDKGEGTSKIKD